ncbi:aminotransferase class I/II-fold pyridoxal phosphate-dependent enzyme [Candidatus Palauibacter soopunensis]|uniref:aminotransferase class I/II-fold pyridoxal phosphate-dependent enzyme n=1 Tax=Candidatus Palauibacter soopunensis TaxID=3056739 RepID=UPI002393B3F0|nr:aminotransferase class I/II-fold pyridoxal phosphate-dependent enzyme [Candidatus Palauibacter soopunensis]MDE2877659.1 aminotransferase class I/II-fold pyridoxal phosphate-dependent enzyme [Candidatus Palauibacter soopunensis]
MRVPPFLMERWQSTFEHRVDYNLSESGVHPLTLSELLELIDLDPGGVRLEYGQSDGSDPLKAVIADLYEGAVPENIIVTTGGAEANYVVLWSLVSAGDRVVALEPTYGQTPGLARGLGADVVSWKLDETRGWQPAPGSAAEVITPGTRLVIVTNPNNPTGAVLTASAMDEIVGAAEAVGAWILADEVYVGAEVEGPETPSFWGRYDRVIVTGSLSKAYALPGLRLGWITAPAHMHEEFWSRKDYTTITPATLSDVAARRVLSADVRPRVLERTRGIIRANLSRVTRWLDDRADLFSYRAPEAGAICYVRYGLDINSTELAERLRAERGVLVVPGDHFGMDHYLRIGFGSPAAALDEALDRVAALLEEACAAVA